MDPRNTSQQRLTLNKQIALGLIVFLVYLPCLFNDFVGDDHLLVADNSFYQSWSNFPRLFQSGYNVDPATYLIGRDPDKGTGSVAYRPVLSTSYFIDRGLWQGHPLGYHLQNLLWHLANVFIVYLILIEIYPPAAFGAALVFGLHPVQTEAVCAIGYRADLLATFFCLSSFLFWLKYHLRAASRWNLLLSAACYFLAVFSKEPAVLLPLIFLTFAHLCPERIKIRLSWTQAALWVGLAAFYLWVYLCVFPNPTIASQSQFLGDNIGIHILTILRIWRMNLQFFLLPWTATLIPALYYPAVQMNISLAIVADLIVAGGCLIFILMAVRRSKIIGFFAFWYVIFYLPVSNIFPNPNPMAMRYLYLPSIGLSVIIITGWKLVVHLLNRWKGGGRWFPGLNVLVVALLAGCTFLLTFFWKNDFIVASTWIRHYPDHHKGYAVMGGILFRAGLYSESRDYYLLSQQRHVLAPDDEFKLALCDYHLDDLDNAREIAQTLVTDYPDFTLVKILLGDIAMKQKQATQALSWFKQAWQEAPGDLQIVDRLINCLARLGRFDEAAGILEKSKTLFSAEKILHLKRHLTNNP